MTEPLCLEDGGPEGPQRIGADGAEPVYPGNPVAFYCEWVGWSEFRAAEDMPAAWDDPPTKVTPLYEQPQDACAADYAAALEDAARQAEAMVDEGFHDGPAIATAIRALASKEHG